jgi:hypothetical protein
MMTSKGGRAAQNLESFPIWATLKLVGYFILILPYWIPIVGVLVVIVLLNVLGVPLHEHFFPLDVFSRVVASSWDLEVVEISPYRDPLDIDFEERSTEMPRECASAGVQTIKLTVSYKKRQFSLFGRYCAPRQQIFSYEGDVDPRSLVPSGVGTWRDSQGEYLHGYWRDGLPQAPYSSREFKARGAFKAVLIGVATASAAPVDQVRDTLKKKITWT